MDRKQRVSPGQAETPMIPRGDARTGTPQGSWPQMGEKLFLSFSALWLKKIYMCVCLMADLVSLLVRV